jgi:hypothetical protein
MSRFAEQEAVMNSDELKGKGESLAERAKEALARAKGAVQKNFGHAKKDVADEKEKHEQKAAGKADPTEEK